MTTSKYDVDAITDALSLLHAQLQTVATPSIPGLERILRSTGKRRRPKLLFTILQHSGTAIGTDAIHAACAVELVHLASLIHDDILDKGTVRRGVRTISAVEGPDTALLAGDYLLAQACAFAARIDADCGQLVADTIVQMCVGEAQEMTSRYDIKRTVDNLIMAVEGKTASLFVAAALLGGRLVEVSQADLEALRGFAHNYGIAYQLDDDIQDFLQPKDKSGKTAMYDYEEGNYTLPILFALQGPEKSQLQRLLGQANSHQQMGTLLDENKYFTQAKAHAEQYQNMASAALKNITNTQLSAALRQFNKF